ncbi:MFS transporter [Brevibacterium senegalense]|uniref:MFS transporter n=1 Tax=Brevibacterium senegalense TaxID=1033736 RepID=UPI0002E584AD|nr:MFS transporter [Brevibacterium senegalense]
MTDRATGTHSGVRRLKLAVASAFLLSGLGMSSWVTQTPVIRDLIGATTAQMGIVLFGVSLGSMAGILASGALVARWGARPVIVSGTAGIAASLGIITCGTALGSATVVMAGLAVFGLGMGCAEVAMNVEGAEVETRTGRPFLSLVHGSYSLGTLVGSGLGIVAVSSGIMPLVHLPVIGALIAIALLRAARELPPATGRTRPTAPVTTATAAATVTAGPEDSGPPPPARVAASAPAATSPTVDGTDATAAHHGLRSVVGPRLLLIALITLAMALTEGTANDWLPLVMVDGHGLDPRAGSAMFAVFAAAMTVGRFLGNPVVARFGRTRVLAVSAGFGVLGLGLVSFVEHLPLAIAAVVLWGLGTSLGFPVAISAAGSSGPGAASRIAVASMIGYLALLAGPPVLGFAGEHWGLRAALLIPLAVMVLAIPTARAARPVDQGARREVVSTSRAGRRRSG